MALRAFGIGLRGYYAIERLSDAKRLVTSDPRLSAFFVRFYICRVVDTGMLQLRGNLRHTIVPVAVF